MQQVNGAQLAARVHLERSGHSKGLVVEDADTPAQPGDYISHEGLLLVRPYHFDFIFGCKTRHEGQNVIDIFAHEFPQRSRSYYAEAFADGRLRVDARGKVTATTPLLAGQRIRHFLHRHEPPVLDSPVQVLGMTEDVVAVSKPPCMPVHAAGQYRKNTVAGRLQALRPDLGVLLPVHRLDKPVSGVLLFARSPAAARRLSNQIQNGEMEKVYMARVSGVFPEGPVVATAPLCWDPESNEARTPPRHDDSSLRSQPGNGAQDAAHSVSPTARGLVFKHAETAFRRVAVAADGQSSLVECRPITGRSHQIRVHLQHLGHPIANDWQYGGTFGSRPSAGAAAAAMAAAASAVDVAAAAPPESVPADDSAGGGTSTGSQAVTVSAGSDGAGRGPASSSSVTDSLRSPAAGLPSGGLVLPTRLAAASLALQWESLAAGPLVDDEYRDRLCQNCPSLIPRGWPTDLQPLWLHALKYGCQGEWSFTCPLPTWAEQQFG